MAEARFGRRSLARKTLRRTWYSLSEFPLAIVRFVALLGMFLVGIGTFVTLLGIPILSGTMLASRGFADLDRRRLSYVQGWRARRPTYRTASGRTGLSRFFVPLRQGQSWADWGHGLLGLFPALLGFAFTLSWWVVAVVGTTSFLYQWAVPRGQGEVQGLASLLGFGREGVPQWITESAFNTLVGLIFSVTLPAVIWACAAMSSGLARVMLTSESVEELHDRVSDLTESRNAAVSAEAAALRRLERDIHDGPQQRLVRLAMDLSSVQRRLDKDPEAARQLLTEAVGQTRETLDELRALSRGIAPPILADRGIRAALAAVAGRSIVPVELSVELPTGLRLPPAVENAAYFVVAEALTNVAKHSGATRCHVAVTLAAGGTLARVIITDNGSGGAHTAKGHGLAGLTDRVRAIGGRLEVESPIGGPTLLSAELPCGS